MYNYRNAKDTSRWAKGLVAAEGLALAAPALVNKTWGDFDYSVLQGERFRLRAQASQGRIKRIFARSALDKTREADFESAAFLAVVKSSSLWHMQAPYKKCEVERLLTTPPPDYKSLNFQTTFGVEEEFFGLKRFNLALLGQTLMRTSPDWLLTEDASIKPTDNTLGKELVSPILTKDNAQRLHSVTCLIQGLGGRADLPCALHIHAGIQNTFHEDVQIHVLKQVMINYMAIEGMLSELKSDLVSSYEGALELRRDLVPWAEQVLKYDDKDFILEKFNFFGRRKNKINTDPLGILGTIEFREHPGSVSPKEVFLWLKFVNGLFKISCDMLAKHNQATFPKEEDRAALCDLVNEYRKERGFSAQKELPQADFFKRMKAVYDSDEMVASRQKRDDILAAVFARSRESRRNSRTGWYMNEDGQMTNERFGEAPLAQARRGGRRIST
jgi:hypothetical protein